MIENLIMQFGALGIVAWLVYYQNTTTNKILSSLRGAIEKNTYVIEYCYRKEKKEKEN